MKAKIKKLWVAALRSGKYKQATGALKVHDSFCCLGVLCDLHSKESNLVWRDDDGEMKYFDEEGILPDPVIKWAGIAYGNPSVTVDTERTDLAEVNDAGFSFNEIAALIEEQL